MARPTSKEDSVRQRPTANRILLHTVCENIHGDSSNLIASGCLIRLQQMARMSEAYAWKDDAGMSFRSLTYACRLPMKSARPDTFARSGPDRDTVNAPQSPQP
jgi:hypothetical protein